MGSYSGRLRRPAVAVCSSADSADLAGAIAALLSRWLVWNSDVLPQRRCFGWKGKVVNIDMERLPDFLTVEEAAAILRIGRTKAYQLVNLGFATEGREGLPARRVGRQVRIPLRALEAMNGGPLGPRGSSSPS